VQGTFMDEIADKVAIVTGAASGIGKGCAVALANAGARVVLSDIDMAGAEAAAHEIIQCGGEAIAVHCDVGRDGSFEALRDVVLDRWGRVDIVMNNAGVILSGHPEDIPVFEWQRVLNINLMSVVRSNAVFLPILLAQQAGHIVNTASFAGIMTYSFDRLPYAASKAAIFQISEWLALYLRPMGIGVTVLCPGPVATNIMSSTKVWTNDVQMRGPGEEFELLTPPQVGEQVVNAIRTNQFFLPTHPAVTARLVKRARDFDENLQNQIAHPSILAVAKLRRNA
jgi:NAD(P)-dependent dehydrogenase (short-subunit alcohol dehydrogenase family)